MKSTDYDMRGSMDGFGITLSALCLVHCLVLPIALALLPMLSHSSTLGWLSENEWFHIAMLGPIFLVSGSVLLRGAKRDIRIGYMGGTGIALLCIALLMPDEMMETIVTTLGTVTLILAHIMNLRTRALG
ncbi:MerC domain-containing protein [Alterisphingorhabdus coralli]|uniref:MerC domain-containing protein n=1 Tax=Alterisphingorhabdus coralli TaxID=3071408 RepID=A0AA97I075_9SPHN|nr:MerC domain-containing protein [Parasphingorhabdus sp. SCSIO 66989]WOE73875.1 MerC domain-containing protein [Parasphingorhabdus sp. SCSIO 66989]